jgi:histidinol phosphatase-like enzyme
MPAKTLLEADVIGFDVDGTLVESWSPQLLDGVAEALDALRDRPLFVATNQGGLFWRALTGQRKFPSPRRLTENITQIAAAAGLTEVPWYVAIHPGPKHDSEKKLAIVERVRAELDERLTASGVFAIPPQVAADLDWRKPAAGMLLAGLAHYEGQRLAYVGDMDTDREAAENAGALFVDAATWRAQV